MCIRYQLEETLLQLDGTSLILTISLASILVLSGFSVILNEQAHAGLVILIEICNNGIDDDLNGLIDAADPQCPGPPFGDFQCWNQTGIAPQSIFVPMTIQDQFGSVAKTNVVAPGFELRQVEYCAAADKTIFTAVGDIVGFFPSPFPALEQHYRGWEILDDLSGQLGYGKEIKIIVPQFDDLEFDTVLGKPFEILVPANKTLASGDKVDSLDLVHHWLCYDLPPESFFEQFITLKTQHTQFFWNGAVFEPILFCTPIIKSVSDGLNGYIDFGEIIDEHLTCFRIEGDFFPDPIPFQVSLDDQFAKDLLFPIDQNEEKLCVESFKACPSGTSGTLPDDCFPLVGGSLIPVNTTMVLLAGTQSVAAWMIPVIVAGIGFAIVISRKL